MASQRALSSRKQPPKAERLEARLTREQKQIIERAAEISGTTVTGFVVASAQAAATETLKNFEALSLQGEASRVFVKALLNPPAPNARAKAAWRRYKDRVAR